MARYLIKVTYLEGSHEGESYLMRKGGWPTDENRYEFEDTTYATLGLAQRECRRLVKVNEQNVEDENYHRAWRERNGFRNSEYRSFYREAYEPYRVEIN